MQLTDQGWPPGPSHGGPVERVLWLHDTDRWYFGDFLRHASWLEWLRQAYPRARLDVASHPDYLPLYGDDRFSALLDARDLGAGDLGAYDLVVIPAPYERPPPAGNLPMVLTTWDSGWAVYVRGRRQLKGTKQELNYFRAAHPATITGVRETTPSRVLVQSAERDAVSRALSVAFPDASPVVIYNPTASNPFTRGTDLPKEVDNTLTAQEHVSMLSQLVASLPDHRFLVGSALKPGDGVNAQVLQKVARLCASDRVISITDLPLPGATTLRGFAAVLNCARVCTVTGAGTGTNTHLASVTGTHSFSIEHGADAHMLANWRRPTDFQMGSFRWRNPSLLAAVHTMNWARKTPAALDAAAAAFLCHHALAHARSHTLFIESAETPVARVGAADWVAGFAASWPHDPIEALRCGRGLLGAMTATARAHYGDFTDEATYLQVAFGTTGSGLPALLEAVAQARQPAEPGTRVGLAAAAVQLFEDSNLHKLLVQLAAPHVPPLAGLPAVRPDEAEEVVRGRAAVRARG